LSHQDNSTHNHRDISLVGLFFGTTYHWGCIFWFQAIPSHFYTFLYCSSILEHLCSLFYFPFSTEPSYTAQYCSSFNPVPTVAHLVTFYCIALLWHRRFLWLSPVKTTFKFYRDTSIHEILEWPWTHGFDVLICYAVLDTSFSEWIVVLFTPKVHGPTCYLPTWTHSWYENKMHA
jgi:hypothetical protein